MVVEVLLTILAWFSTGIVFHSILYRCFFAAYKNFLHVSTCEQIYIMFECIKKYGKHKNPYYKNKIILTGSQTWQSVCEVLS